MGGEVYVAATAAAAGMCGAREVEMIDKVSAGNIAGWIEIGEGDNGVGWIME